MRLFAASHGAPASNTASSPTDTSQQKKHNIPKTAILEFLLGNKPSILLASPVHIDAQSSISYKYTKKIGPWIFINELNIIGDEARTEKITKPEIKSSFFCLRFE